MTPSPRNIITAEDWMRLVTWHSAHPQPYPFRVTFGKARSPSQNNLLHLWFGQIAAQRGDMDASQVKGEMHRQFGLSIRLRNEQFAWVWAQTGARLTYEKQCKLLAAGVLGVSSGMTTKELKEYLDAIQRHAAEQGLVLVNPDERGEG